ncbi:ribosome biogenesis GTP-binding protein YihA/YsxC [Parachlamydia sp. AcF125]|uniref:ribosome biogenesis GTP-binding protein YihA/YsxC n=1 Tax=Parachlamydia sp. AcF125 TaxID=2795736 RepID=UPI001BC943DD|nr:ribosome biogenesis GTP-binding protein YihA/YsxC [Parachlamydia sp. AcF125]MBS4167758.1 putative GTP-binding protein EngB [Parachlamydia sp. AcF125]
MTYSFKNTHFITTAVNQQKYPLVKNAAGHILPEIAVAGRSNVGKSSLLNHLFQAKNLVKTSSTPGKTQALNFFNVDNKLVFVDLPGYGFAQVPIEVRKKWGPLIDHYLRERESLKLILFLFDIRRLPNEDDKLFLEWVIKNQKSMILVFTKIDKVTTNQKVAQTRAILSAFEAENIHYAYYSVPKNLGRKELIAMMNDALAEEHM